MRVGSSALRAGVGAVVFLALGGLARGQDYSGVWDVSGTDARGAFNGTAVLTPNGTEWKVQRLVTYQAKLPDGRDLCSAWNALAKREAAGLRVVASLKRGDFVARAGTLQRTPQDRLPLVLNGLFTGAGATVALGTTIRASYPGGPTETWVRSNRQAPLFPETDRVLNPTHAASNVIRPILFAVFANYHTLPDVAPYAGRADFKAGIHAIPIDHTAREFYRARGLTAVVVLDKVVDEISITEERIRADAFSQKLADKARKFDADMKNLHVDRFGMIAGVDRLPPYKRYTSGDGALHLGVWVASQVYRYQATNDPEAFANVEKGVRALVTLVLISADKTDFARCIEDAQTAPASWLRGTGSYTGIAYKPGGNNDMLHGIDYGLLCAEQVLPAGHPLRAEIATATRQLITQNKVAQKSGHEMIVSYVAWKTTGDPALRDRYKKTLGWKNILNRLWYLAGNGLSLHVQGISDWSGRNLNTLGFMKLRLLGGSSPDLSESSWRLTSDVGIRVAHHYAGHLRHGLASTVAGAARAWGASDQAKDILGEIPCPKPTGDAMVDRRVSGEFSLSPYPSLPWKLDWMTNPGRQQALYGAPLFQKGATENHWARSPFGFTGAITTELPPGEEFLHAYWFGRLTGVIGPND